MISDELKSQWMDVGESIVYKNAGEDFDRSRKLIKSSRYKCCLSECHWQCNLMYYTQAALALTLEYPLVPSTNQYQQQRWFAGCALATA